jgi:hypothetical protein
MMWLLPVLTTANFHVAGFGGGVFLVRRRFGLYLDSSPGFLNIFDHKFSPGSIFGLPVFHLIFYPYFGEDCKTTIPSLR